MLHFVFRNVRYYFPRFFCNKLWNATKFAMMYLGADFQPARDLVKKLSSAAPSRGSSSKAASHEPLPAAAEMDTAAGVSRMNSILASQDFLRY